jgi:hypothetical protein
LPDGQAIAEFRRPASTPLSDVAEGNAGTALPTAAGFAARRRNAPHGSKARVLSRVFAVLKTRHGTLAKVFILDP